MARNLYRFYLYFVFIAMLIFAAVALGQLLQPLFLFTPLRGATGSPPASTEVVQAFVFAIVALIIAGLLGGLHYWLIRRDMRSDPAAGGEGIRAFFLNIAELIIAPLAVGMSAFGVIDSLGYTPARDVTYTTAFAVATLALLGFLEWERQRSKAVTGVALAFQRLHLYGVQLILLAFVTYTWLDTLRWLLDAFAFGGKATGVAPCVGFGGCPIVNLLSMSASLLWIIIFWIGYGYFNRRDASSLLRQVLHFASAAYGVVFLLLGVWAALDLVMKAILSVPITPADVVNPPSATPNFVSASTLGILVIGVYVLWLRIAARQRSGEWPSTLLGIEAIATVLLAGSFWWGCGLVLFDAIASIFPAGNPPPAGDWANAIALVITGVACIPLHLYLLRRNAREPEVASVPWRGFIFALLGGGTLAAAIGAAVALYSFGTMLLGSPLSNWVPLSRSGLVAFIVGAVIVGIYLRITVRQRLFSSSPKPSQPVPASPAPQPQTIEAVLDELLAHKLLRDEAAERIRFLMNPPSAAPAQDPMPLDR